MHHRRGGRVPRRLLSLSVPVAALLVCGVGIAIAQSAPPSRPTSSCDVQTTERLVAIGDVHGAFEPFVRILQEAKLIDGRRRWIGRRAVLVQTGDVPDRGADSRKVFDLLRRLTDDAAKAGGGVHALLGNHEVMRMMGDYRYVSKGEYAAFRSTNSEDLRENYYAQALAANRKQTRALGGEFDEPAFRTRFLDRTPLGFVEMHQAFQAKGEYGRWLREHDTMVKINGVVFMHGGPTIDVATLGCEAVNARVRAELRTVSTAGPSPSETLMAGPQGPLWYRGLADGSPGVGQADVDAIVAALAARAIVVGHTVAGGFQIRPLFGGKVVPIDTGMLDGPFYPGGAASALEIQGGTWTAIYEGRREILRPSASLESPVPRR